MNRPVTLNFRNAPLFCSRISFSANRPKIDLAGIDFIEPSALVYLGTYLRHFNAQGIYFDFVPPTNAKVRKYLADQHFWERFRFSSEVVIREGRLRRLPSSTSPGDIIDIERTSDVAEQVAAQVYRILDWHPHVARIGEIVSELVDNFAIHSRGPLAAFAMQWYPRGKRAIISIGDCGIGIRRTLSTNPQYRHLAKRPHVDAIVEAFKPLVTCRKSGGGTGLTEVQDGVQELGGQIRLVSGDGYVEYRRSGAVCGSTVFDLSGVQVELIIPT